MVHIEFIIPYPELKETVQRVYSLHPKREDIRLRVVALTAEQADGFVPEGDIVIVRGATARQLKRRGLPVPIEEIPITASDVLRSIQRTIYRYHPERIALVGPYEDIYEALDLTDLFGCEIRGFPQHDLEEIPIAIGEAKEWGCDTVIGGYTVHLHGVSRRIPSLIFEVSDRVVTAALNAALNTVEHLRAERERAETFDAVLSSTQDGFVFADAGRVISTLNPAARAFCSGPRDDPVGKRLEDAFPFLRAACADLAGYAGSDFSCKTEAGTCSVSLTPVQVPGRVDSWVVRLRRCQPEQPSRRKPADRGLTAKYHFLDIIHQSPYMTRVIETAKRYAEVSSNILITGETGTGKELLAQSIHNAGARRSGVFLAVNCATLPETLLESELFGYVDGAFTGTVKGGRAGLFELAQGGTLLLDEISEVPLTFQSKLLRVLQEREIRRIGDDRVVPVDVRVMASSNRSLEAMVAGGSFRQDLFFRLDTLKIHIPPLRSRREDIQILFLHFLDRYNQRFGGIITEFSPRAMEMLTNHPFPGNVRELKNIAERLSVNCKGMHYITEQQMHAVLYPGDSAPPQPPVLLPVGEQPELDEIRRVLRECGYNQSRAARMLGINRTTLWRKLQKSRGRDGASG